MQASRGVIALVTGGNRGIGFEIVRQLARREATVILTARRPDAGAAALAKLAREGVHVSFQALSVTDESSIEALAAHVGAKFGRLDVLVNNAGISSSSDAGGHDVSLATVRETLETNTLGPLRMAQALLSLLAKSPAGRIVNVSSGMGALNDMEGGHAAYRISKTALNAVTRILAADLAAHRIAVNSMCPGWVRTDMGGAHAERDVAEGADTAVWLTLDAAQSLTGGFYRDREPIPW